jgi:hypothetical protein
MASTLPDPAPAPAQVDRPGTVGGRERITHAAPVLLLRAAHPRHALLSAVGFAVAAALAGRPGREVALVAGTALVGQTVLGWHNDLVDRGRDATRPPGSKPVADGSLDAGTAWFALICGVLLVVPLSISNGVTAGCCYLAALALGLVANVVLRRSWLSWLPWAAAYALYPAFLSYGGWAGQADGGPPEPLVVVLAAALGVGVHVLVALPGLVADHEDGYRNLALRIALRTGATRLLVLGLTWTVLDLAALLVVGHTIGLQR